MKSAKYNSFIDIQPNHFQHRLAVGCSAYGINFTAKFVNFNMFTVGAIKEFAVFAIILLIVPFFKRVRYDFRIK